MSDDWKKQDRPCPPCATCGAELYEKFWGGGGWAKTDKATEETHSERDCIVRLKEKLATVDLRNVPTHLDAHGAAMIVRCNWCFAVLEEPGALVFTPPDKIGQCIKIHVCVECFKRVILSATPKRAEAQP